MNHGYTLTDPASASDTQREIFDRATAQFGFVPNIVNTFSESPALASAMLDLYSHIPETGFNDVESHVVLQTINVINQCIYCVPAHSTVARSQGVDAGLDNALRDQHTLDDPKLEALRTFTALTVKQRAHITDEQFDAFIDAGYTKQHALEVVFLITVKTLTNYGNHIAGTDLDKIFEPLEWIPQEEPLTV